MPEKYPNGTVRALLLTNQVTEVTRQALTERLETSYRKPDFFSETAFGLLKAICRRLVPQDENQPHIDIAGGIDERLVQNKSDGWRYDTMPADGEAYKLGLAGVEETASLLFEASFQSLSEEQQDEVLQQIQQEDAPGETWKKLPANRFFEELLAEATTNYYSHPLAQEAIGYVGMADVPGWQRIGLNQLEDREPKEIMINDE
ncbi:gluconate 2-dehydrogenase subunit 3 family protein [Spirosoma luteum]|uniref:gluconate 2-dehydrogenase subunit 3 family protein n=1 Tax=Spirosoma luteum TaxID=431553 RepID=UPI0003606C83|nr:gluconate 2-dehydrogenase subunit 3 family protein [Spirosoma luteum]